jgi:hypothetical protein
MLIYRGESRFDLKGTAPVKLPLILNGQTLISCSVESKQAKPNWRNAGELEQFVFLPEIGFTVLKTQTITFGTPQLFELAIAPVSYLRFAPVAWLKFRTNITIKNIMPIYQDVSMPISSSSVSAAAVPVSTAQVLLLAANETRLGFSITNASGNRILYIDFDGNATVTDYALRIPSNSTYEPPVNYTGNVYGIWNGTDATGKAFVREFL